MANKLASIPVGNLGNQAYHSGKPWNVYSSYANAIAHGATGLVAISDFDHIAGTIGASIAQVAKQVGVVPAQDGRLTFFVDDGAQVFIICEGLGVPIRVPVGMLV